MDDGTLHDLIAAIRWTSSADYPGGDLALNNDDVLAREIKYNGIRFTLRVGNTPSRENLFGWTVDDYLYFTGKSLLMNNSRLLWRLPWGLLEQQDTNVLRLLSKEEA